MTSNNLGKVIEFIDVAKEFTNGDICKTALKNINLAVNQGEFVGILGMNGSGKSTLARLANALLQPSAGKVLVKGMDTAEQHWIREIRCSVGMVFQNPDNQLISSIVEEDIAFGPENLGLTQSEVRERVEWAIKILGLGEIRNRAPHLLSGGQKQKVAIASALAMQPSCLVLDEPTSMLDQQARIDLIKNLRMLNQTGITIVVITHNIEDVKRADRLIFLNKGEIQFAGTLETVFAAPEILDEMGFNPPDVVHLIHNLNQCGHNIDTRIMNIHDLAGYICEQCSK